MADYHIEMAQFAYDLDGSAFCVCFHGMGGVRDQHVLYSHSMKEGLGDNGRPGQAVVRVHHGIYLEMLLRIAGGESYQHAAGKVAILPFGERVLVLRQCQAGLWQWAGCR